MASTSKSNRRKNKSKFVPKLKQRWQVKQPTRNWLELPSDLMVNILQRIGVANILGNAQKVCTAWREICKDPAMWRVVYMDRFSGPFGRTAYREMCKQVVDRSQGQLVDLTVIGFCDYELLQYVADRSSQLRRLEIVQHFYEPFEIWTEAFKKLSLLEELSLVRINISQENIEVLGLYCPLLKTLKVNQKALIGWDIDDDDDSIQNEMPLAIAKNLPELTHLELIGNSMKDIGLQAILDGCRHLDSLDLRQCFYLDLKGDLVKRCAQQIKHLKLPHDSLQGCPHAYYVLEDSDFDFDFNSDSDVEYDGYSDFGDEYDGYFDYDDYMAFHEEDGLSEMMAFMDMFG